MRKLIFISACLLLVISTTAIADEKLVDLVKKIKPAVVLIETFNKDNNPLGKGSGFFINKKGHIVTNYHVIKGAYRATVKTSSGKKYTVDGIIAKDIAVDIVKLQVNIPTTDICFLNLNTKVPSEGDSVVVIGNPLGLEASVSTGIVSGVRDMPAFGEILQITAPISIGSSGSPVTDMKGEVIGIATLVLKEGQNLNFAIPSEKIMAVKEIPITPIAKGFASSLATDVNDASKAFNNGLKEPWATEPNRIVLGIFCQTFDKDISRTFLKRNIRPLRAKGLILTRIIENGPADKAGLREFDILFRIDRKPVRDNNELQTVLNSIGAGHQVLAEYFRLVNLRGRVSRWMRQKTFLTPVAASELLCQPGQCPLKIERAIITHNSIDEPVLVVQLSNISTLNIAAYIIEIFCFNKFDDPVLGLNNSNRISAIGQSTIKVFEKTRQTITLHFRDTVGKLKISVIRVKFNDGNEWNRKQNEDSFYVVEK